MLRDTIKTATITAMKAGDKPRTAALRLIQAKIKDRDIELRTGTAPADDDVLVAEVLARMAKQRRESIELYDAGGRQELADQERAELAVIEQFMPRQLDEAATRAAIAEAKAATGAAGMKDMARLMAALKDQHGTALDMSLASKLAKEALA